MKTMLKPVVTKILADINYKGDPTVEFYEEGCTIKFSSYKKSRFAIFVCLTANGKICVKIINYWIENYFIKNNIKENSYVYFTILDELADIRHSSKYWELIRVIKELDHYKYWKTFIKDKRKKKYYWWNYIDDWFEYE